MLGKILGRIAGLPVRVVAVPFRVLDRMVGVRDDLPSTCTPGTILRDAARAIEQTIEETTDGR